MNYWQSVRIALRALKVNALRSVLTMLGIVIGVGAVITMIAVGSGGQAQVVERIRSLGANLLVVTPGAQIDGRARLGAGTRHTLIEDDAEAIAAEISSIVVAAPAVIGNAQIIYGNRNWSTSIAGVVPDHLVARDWRPRSGAAFTLTDVDSASKVALLGATAAEKLFEDEDPVGKLMRIGTVPFLVVGVLEAKGQSASGRDQDDFVMIPLTTAKMRVLGGKHEASRRAVDYIYVKVNGASAMDTAERQIAALLRHRHRQPPDAPDDFQVRNLTSIFAAGADATRTLGMLLAAVASVSLVVGGISIMNILLVSITERTREIGVRMAVGARPSNIRNQFLIEAVTLALFGGIGGIICGVAAAVAFAWAAGWPILITPATILLAVGFSAAVGIFFGFYPAHKASNLDPIEALRFE
jgi:putative ABC transport system permease protein